MISLLTPPQISSLWRVIKIGIEGALPPLAGEAPDKTNRILSLLMQGKMQCWLGTEQEGESKSVKALAVTMLCTDEPSGQKDLLIYCLYAYDRNAKLAEYFIPIGKWAASRRCTRVTAYSNNDHVIRLVEKLGGSARFRFIEIPIQP